MTRHLRSWVFWGAWIVAGLAWELWCVFRERRDGDEPLTRIVRDRVMRSRYPWIAWPARVVVFGFLLWLIPHWLVGIAW